MLLVLFGGNLSDSQKALLKFRVGGSDSNAQALITQMVMKGLDNTVDLEIDYQNDLNTDGSKKKILIRALVMGANESTRLVIKWICVQLE